VAAGLLPVAQASDGAGSIRIPASFCGLCGHKPSRDLLPNPYRHVDTLGMSTSGAITRTVADAAALLDVLLRRKPGAAGSFLDALHQPLPALRVRFTTTAPLGTTAPEVAAAVLRVAAVLAGLGHDVSETPPLTATLDEFLPIYQRLAANAPVFRSGLLQPVTRWLRVQGRRYRHGEVLQMRDTLAARILAFCGDADVVLTPTVPVLPPVVGSLMVAQPAESFARAAVLGAFTAMCNLSGQPASSVPAGQCGGLPIGVQLVGRPGADATVLALAQQLVAALPPLPAPPGPWQ
jgi:amidase